MKIIKNVFSFKEVLYGNYNYKEIRDANIFQRSESITYRSYEWDN